MISDTYIYIFQKIIGSTIVNFKEIETNSHYTLNWIDLFDRTGKVGKIFLAVEIIHEPNESTETNLIVPLIRTVQPKHRIYQ